MRSLFGKLRVLPLFLVLSTSGLVLSLHSPSRAGDVASCQTLFAINRSKNKNIVNYDVCKTKDGAVDPDTPLVAYWVLRAEDGRRESLSWLERQFGYGFSILSDVGRDGFKMKLKAFPKRSLEVRRTRAHGFRAFVKIAGKRASLTSLYVKSTDGGAMPRVEYVDVFGTDIASGEAVRERLLP